MLTTAYGFRNAAPGIFRKQPLPDHVRQTEALCKKLTKPAKPPKAKDDNFTRPKRAVEVEAALKEVTGSEVHVDYKDGKGSLKIDFYSDDMLQKFVSLLGMYDPEG